MKKLLIFFLPAILLGCDSPAYRNPLDVAFGDPFILHAADGKFYMYGTSGDIRGFRVCVSDDLVTWQKGDVVYDGNASAWGTDCFWAPEVYERDGRYYLFFSANWRHNPNGDLEIYELTEYLKDKKFGVINISKSGTTTETALAFRLLKKQCEDQRGKDMAKKVIVAITDAKKGAARVTADNEGYKSFIIPDNVGGRFSVLTPVGLLPIAIAGFDIEKLVAGAVAMEKACGKDVPFAENPAAIYAATRNELYKNGKKIEILVNYNPKLHYVSEWWKQLYGESEGKENKGIFPAAVDFSTDLHSMGQWIQEGERTIYETVISVEKTQHSLQVPSDEANLDGLNFLAGKHVDEVNKMAELGTQLAHVDGGVPNMRIVIPALNEESIGGLLYFFEIACGISGYILGVNPFNQPGVEAYKKNMFALLNKPGYEEESKAIQARL